VGNFEKDTEQIHYIYIYIYLFIYLFIYLLWDQTWEILIAAIYKYE
jgi:hypothetical protein